MLLQVLAEEPKNAKALFRRGRARHLLGQTEAALEDLTKARQAAPSDANIARELQAVRTVLQQVRLLELLAAVAKSCVVAVRDAELAESHCS